MAIIRDNTTPANTLKVNADGSINTSVSLGEIEVKNDTGNPVPISDAGGSLTVDGSVSVSNFPATQPVSGSVSVSNLPTTQAVSGTVTTNQGTAGASAWKVDGSGVTQPVSGTVTANAGTGTFTVSGSVNADVRTGGSATSAANPLPAQLSQGNAAVSATNPIPAQLSYGGAAVTQANPTYAAVPPSQVLVSVGTANTALTVTIPAGAAGQFTYITRINISRANGATATTAGTAASAITTTNLGTLAFRYTTAVLGAGATDNFIDRVYTSPLKSAASATASTIVLPTPGGTSATAYWIVEVEYFYAP